MNVEISEQVDARKEPYGEREALALVKQVHQLYAAKGKKVVHIDLKKEKPDKDTLRQALLGPTGNLRAPTIRQGKTLVVGFHLDVYRKLFG